MSVALDDDSEQSDVERCTCQESKKKRGRWRKKEWERRRGREIAACMHCEKCEMVNWAERYLGYAI